MYDDNWGDHDEVATAKLKKITFPFHHLVTVALAGGIFGGLNCSVTFDSGAGRERAYALRSGADAGSAYSSPETCCRFDTFEQVLLIAKLSQIIGPFDSMSNDKMDGEFGLEDNSVVICCFEHTTAIKSRRLNSMPSPTKQVFN